MADRNHRVRVLQLTGQPLVLTERHVSRPSGMCEGPTPMFPDWFQRRDIEQHFEIVNAGAEVAITTVTYMTTVAELLGIQRQICGLPIVVIYTLDDFHEPTRGGWDRPRDWIRAIVEFSAGADLLAGPQLPLDLKRSNLLPLPYAPVVPFAARERLRTREHEYDVYFSGAWQPSTGTEPVDTRDRRYRGYLVHRLLQDCSHMRLDLGRVHFWRSNPLDPGQPVASPIDKPALLRQHTQALDRARIALAPSGHAFYTARHSDVMARGVVLLSEAVQRRVLVPRPDLWESGQVALLYDNAEHCISEVLPQALSDASRLDRVATAGWNYAQEFLSSDRQVEQLADAVRSLKGSTAG